MNKTLKNMGLIGILASALLGCNHLNEQINLSQFDRELIRSAPKTKEQKANFLDELKRINFTNMCAETQKYLENLKELPVSERFQPNEREVLKAYGVNPMQKNLNEYDLKCIAYISGAFHKSKELIK